MRQLTLGALACILTACSSPEEDGDFTARDSFVTRDSVGIEIVESLSPAWTESETWTLDGEPLFVLHGYDGGDTNRLLDPTSVDVDSRGRIIVGDGDQAGWHAILVYDSLGVFQFQAGRDGRGPGEFGQLWWASSYRGDSIVAFDMAGDRLSIFSPEGEFVRSLRTPQMEIERGPPGSTGFTAGADAAYADGHFLAYPTGRLDASDGPGPAWFKHLLFRLSPDGESWDTLGTFEISQLYWSGTSQEQLWLAPFTVSAVGTSDLFFGKGEAFEIRRFDGKGRLTRIIRRSHTPRPVTEELRGKLRDWYLDLVQSSPEVNDEVLERIRQDFEAARIVDHLPAYSYILLDDAGNLWVEEFRWLGRNDRSPISEPTHWSVFGPDGVWLGNVQTPSGFILREVSGDRALGFVVDEFGVKEIHAHALHRGS